jgi:hypothetical protein
MAQIVQFVQAHLKSIVTVGFVCGLVSVILRILDEKLSDDRKEKFGEWISELAPALDSLNLRNLRNFFQYYWFGYLVVLALIVSIMLMITIPRIDTEKLADFLAFGSDDPSFTLGMEATFACIALIFGAIFFRVFLERHDSLTVWQYLWAMFRVWCFSVSCPVALWALVALGLCLFVPDFRDDFGPFSMHDVVKVAGILISGIPLVALSLTVISSIPLFALILLRVPIALTGRGMWWLATYKKGPWSGLVFALTTGLGILRLFM